MDLLLLYAYTFHTWSFCVCVCVRISTCWLWTWGRGRGIILLMCRYGNDAPGTLCPAPVAFSLWFNPNDRTRLYIDVM